MNTFNTFLFCTGDEMTDPYFVLTVNGIETRVRIQDCRAYDGGFAVNLDAPSSSEDFWVEDCGVFRSFAKAKAHAIHVYKTKGQE